MYQDSVTWEFGNALVIDIAEALVVYVVLLIYICTMTHLYMYHDSFTYVPGLCYMGVW